jgi:hypothetical protein
MELVRNGEIVDTPAAKSAYATAVLGVNAVEGDMGAEVGEPSEPVGTTGAIAVFDTNGYRKALKEAAELAEQGAV